MCIRFSVYPIFPLVCRKEAVNTAFFTLALQSGLSAGIINPSVTGYDECLLFIQCAFSP